MRTEIFEEIDSLYKLRLNPRKLVVDRIPKREKRVHLLLFLTCTCFISTFALWTNALMFARVGFLLAGGLVFFLMIRLRIRSEFKILSDLEDKFNLNSDKFKSNYRIRVSRIQQYLILKFSKRKLRMRKRELIELGEDIHNLYGDNLYQIKSPDSLITTLLAIEALVLSLLKVSALSDVQVAQIIGINIGVIFLILLCWLIIKSLGENWVNSDIRRYIAIKKILIGLKYSRKEN